MGRTVAVVLVGLQMLLGAVPLDVGEAVISQSGERLGAVEDTEPHGGGRGCAAPLRPRRHRPWTAPGSAEPVAASA
ncbi:hypothetical protein [Streptomyces atratus]|uniref:hypothetical protein n=1 Tax=Streptomyces atratus TaxID=1893 RepID=UPI00224E9E93|nr:hypothetical protein [Streptomyces atratus]MCX5342751.1 hypothetical protein [Streptomyces atratus]